MSMSYTKHIISVFSFLNSTGNSLRKVNIDVIHEAHDFNVQNEVVVLVLSYMFRSSWTECTVISKECVCVFLFYLLGTLTNSRFQQWNIHHPLSPTLLHAPQKLVCGHRTTLCFVKSTTSKDFLTTENFLSQRTSLRIIMPRTALLTHTENHY